MAKHKRLRVLRADRDLSQMEVAVKAKIGLYRYWQIENGYAHAKAEERERIARALKTPETELWPEQEVRAS